MVYLLIKKKLIFGLFIQGPANLVRDASCWQLEHEWRQDIAVVTKWLSGVSPVCWQSLSSTHLIHYLCICLLCT